MPAFAVDEFGNLESGDDGDFVLGRVAAENESDNGPIGHKWFYYTMKDNETDKEG